MLKFYWSLFKVNKKSLLIILIIFISSLLSFLIPYINGNLIDVLTENSKFDFVNIMMILILINLFVVAFNFWAEAIVIKMQSRINLEFKEKLIDSVYCSTLQTRDKTTSNEFQYRCNEINNLDSLLSVNLYKLITSTILMMITLIYILFISKTLFISLLIFAPIYYYLNKVAFNNVNSSTKEVIEQNTELSTKLGIFYNSIHFFQLLNYSTDSKIKIKEEISQTVSKQAKMKQKVNLLSGIIQITNIFSILFVAFISGILYLSNFITIGMFISLQQYASYVFLPLLLLSTTNLNFQPGLITYKRTKEYIESNTTDIQKGTIRFATIESVEIKKIEDPLIKLDIKFCLTRNQIYMIVGKNGTGKSTIFKTILKQYSYPGNEIYINGYNIEDICITCINDCIHYCPQEIILLNTTIEKNVYCEFSDDSHVVLEKIIKEDSIVCKIMNDLDFEKNINSNFSNISPGEKKK